ncbi:MAG: DNA-processing protein DprA [Vicinamibacterales bacterium]
MLDRLEAALLSVARVSRCPSARKVREAWRRHQRLAAGVLDPPTLSTQPADSLVQALLEESEDCSTLEAALDDTRRDAACALEAASRAGISTLVLGQPGYPALLAPIDDPPPLLWVRGRPEALDRMLVAIVGARAACSASLEIAERLAAGLAAIGVATASGMARGVDGAAHRGTLAAGGTTVAVLGCGADVVYPPEHTRLAAEIVEKGALLSELPPGTPPRPAHFPLRNRIISGLSLGVVVVEAGERSGSLITARAALEQGREVVAVPGSVASQRNRGCHDLIKDGAALVEDTGDIVAALGQWQLFREWRRRQPAAEPGEDPLLGVMLRGEPYDLDSLAAASSVPPVALLPRLLALELSGAVKRDPAGRFVRLSRSC